MFSLLSAAIIASSHFALTSEMIKRDHLFRARGEKHAARQPRACARSIQSRVGSLATGEVNPRGLAVRLAGFLH